MKNYKLLLFVIGFSYLVIYGIIRLNGLVYNQNMYQNNYFTNNKIILIFSVPGCFLENCIFYTCTYGWRGTPLAFNSLNINYSEPQNQLESNDILWWNLKDNKFKRNIHF